MATADARGPVTNGPEAIIPTLLVHDATAALAFYRRAFGAEETMRLPYPDGRIGHAEIRIGAAPVMLADEHPNLGYLAPRSLGGSPVPLTLYVDDAGAWLERAVEAGAIVKCPLRDEFHGDRTAQVVDPFGHVWTLSTRIEPVDTQEIVRRFHALTDKDASAPKEDAK